MGKSLVVYYSWIGNTKVIADEISKLTDGDVRRIEEVKVRKRGIGFGTAAFSAILGLKSRLKPMDYNLDQYENVFLGAQVWASRSTPAINSFIDKTNFQNKKVYLFITKADEKVPQKVIDSIRKRIEKTGGKVIDTLSITTKIDQIIEPEATSEKVKE